MSRRRGRWRGRRAAAAAGLLTGSLALAVSSPAWGTGGLLGRCRGRAPAGDSARRVAERRRQQPRRTRPSRCADVGAVHGRRSAVRQRVLPGCARNASRRSAAHRRTAGPRRFVPRNAPGRNGDRRVGHRTRSDPFRRSAARRTTWPRPGHRHDRRWLWAQPVAAQSCRGPDPRRRVFSGARGGHPGGHAPCRRAHVRTAAHVPASTDQRGFAAAISNAGDAVIAWIEPGLAGGRGTVRATSCAISTSTCEAPTDFSSTASPELDSLAVAASSAGAFAMAWKQTTSQRTGDEIRVIRGSWRGCTCCLTSVCPLARRRTCRSRSATTASHASSGRRSAATRSASATRRPATLRSVAAAAGIAFKHSIRISGPAADEGSSLWLTPSRRALIVWSEKRPHAGEVGRSANRTPACNRPAAGCGHRRHVRRQGAPGVRLEPRISPEARTRDRS